MVKNADVRTLDGAPRSAITSGSPCGHRRDLWAQRVPRSVRPRGRAGAASSAENLDELSRDQRSSWRSCRNSCASSAKPSWNGRRARPGFRDGNRRSTDAASRCSSDGLLHRAAHRRGDRRRSTSPKCPKPEPGQTPPPVLIRGAAESHVHRGIAFFMAGQARARPSSKLWRRPRWPGRTPPLNALFYLARDATRSSVTWRARTACSCRSRHWVASAKNGERAGRPPPVQRAST